MPTSEEKKFHLEEVSFMATSGTDGPKRRPRTKRVDASHEQRHFDIALGDEANEGHFSRSLYIIEKSRICTGREPPLCTVFLQQFIPSRIVFYKADMEYHANRA